MTISQGLAAFAASIRHQTVPDHVLHSTRLTLFNSYGIAMGCLPTAYAPIATRAALSAYGEVAGGATILGDGRTTTVGGASLANGALFHGRAQEDTVGGAHLGVVLVPLLTALFEARKLPMDRFVPSVLAGFEVGGRLEQVFAPHTSLNKFRPTTLFGTIAAAVAAATALDLPEDRIEAAISMSYGFVGGTLQSFGDGTDEWRYQPGFAAGQGFLAAELAAAGATTTSNAFEGVAGLGPVYGNVVDIDEADLLEPLGREWQVLRNAFKKYPVCAFNQALVTACLQIEPLEVREIDRVRIYMNPYELSLPGMMFDGPFHTVGQTLMSVSFGAAATLVRGTPTLAVMNAFDDTDILSMVQKIDIVPDESVSTLSSKVEIQLQNGDLKESSITTDPKHMNLDRPELSEMLTRVAHEVGVEPDLITALGDFVFDIDRADTITPLIGLFADARQSRTEPR